MGQAKRVRKFGAVRTNSSQPPSPQLTTLQVKRIIGQNDARLKKNQDKGEVEGKKKEKGDEIVREM